MGTVAAMRVHLVDGTYELFRQHFGRRPATAHPTPGRTRRRSVCSARRSQLVADGATHVGVASDHVIESFRNDLWPGYKTSAGMPPELLAQIPVIEEALVSAGFTMWAMVEYEADDALGAAAAVADADARVEQVLIVTPDKDLGQCVRGTRVVQYDRRKREIVDEAGVIAEVRRRRRRRSPTTSASSATPPTASRAARLGRQERRGGARQVRPPSRTSRRRSGDWGVPGLRGTEKLAATLRDHLSRRCCSGASPPSRLDVEVGSVDDWRWTGPTPSASRPSPTGSACPSRQAGPTERSRRDRRELSGPPPTVHPPS